MWMLFHFSGLVEAALFSEVNAGAWSPLYCRARRRNFRIIFCRCGQGNLHLPPKDIVQGPIGPSPGADIDHFPTLGQNIQDYFFLTSHERHTVVADQPCSTLSDKRFALRRFCVDRVNNHSP
ncbi:hypothetical protein PoB_000399900 [Plakobranchus ocellatus]|uniref:Secreted protein n=1 Tax=Plakobranchus ocellatus TaxID=259542 RepID=A0AAV3Y5H8_9GAST|nr:hypothetical protein PoB_000399900 [Plakobranchus ocellatus]